MYLRFSSSALFLFLSLSTIITATSHPPLHQNPSRKSSQTSAAVTTLIPSTSLTDYDTFQSYFSYLYPWGSDHNGAARMVGNASFHEFIFLSNTSLSSTDDTPTPTLNLLSVVAPPGQPPSTNAGSMDPTINYFSGTVHATQSFAVNETGQMLEFEAEVIAPVIRGTWPAFWLTAVVGWPPEADLGEWKGDGDISFNTFNTSSIVDSVNVDYPDPDEFHTIRATVVAEDSSNVVINYFLDDVLQSTQVGSDFVGAALWLIIDLQMEGSSGTPGPTGNTTYLLRNIVVTQTS